MNFSIYFICYIMHISKFKEVLNCIENISKISKSFFTFPFCFIWNIHKLSKTCYINKWIIINENGDQIGSETFEDIKLDKTLVAFRNDVAFAQINGKYYLIDKMGKVVCDTAFEDADAFASEGYAAVQYEGAWGFVDTKGNFVIKPQYLKARSFTDDLAAVSDGTEWVFINTNNDIVIRGGSEETNEEKRELLMYEDVIQFSDDGSAFVKSDGAWHQIRLFRQALS